MDLPGYISPRASISSRALVSPSARIFGEVVVGDFVFLDAGVTIGYPSPREQDQLKAELRSQAPASDRFDEMIDGYVEAPTHVGAHSFLRSGSIVYSGSVLEESVDVAHNVHVREDCVLGRGTHVITGAQIMAAVHIGRHCRIAGTLCNRCRVGDGTSMMGHLMHAYRIAVPGEIEASPRVGNGVLIGRESAVIGDVEIDDFAIVGAGAVITESIHSGSIWAHNPAIRVGSRSQKEIEKLARYVTDARDG
jgi:UDP-2-acetamido-3-amino-2,3-dideoxy-glucuronate N-acetyltransferase